MIAPSPLEIAADAYEAITYHLAGELLDAPDAERTARVLALRASVETRQSDTHADALVDDIARQWIERRRTCRLTPEALADEDPAAGFAAWLRPFERADVQRFGTHLRATAGDDLADRVAHALRTPGERARDEALAAAGVPRRGDERARQRAEEARTKAVAAPVDLLGDTPIVPDDDGAAKHAKDKAKKAAFHNGMAALAAPGRAGV